MTTRSKLIIAAGVIGLPVIGLAFYVWTIALEAAEAEETLHAVIFSRDLLYNYTKNNPCKWPSSWEDLKTVKQSPSAFYTWPDDMDEIKKRVRIDFASSYCNLLNKNTEFKPIAPIGPCYSHKQYLNWLKDEMRQQDCCMK